MDGKLLQSLALCPTMLLWCHALLIAVAQDMRHAGSMCDIQTVQIAVYDHVSLTSACNLSQVFLFWVWFYTDQASGVTTGLFLFSRVTLTAQLV